MLEPAGPSAEIIARLWWILLAGATLIFVGVMGLAVYAMLEHRRGRDLDGIRLIAFGGIGLPFIVLSPLLLLALRDGERLLAHPAENAFIVEVTGHQWWWEFVYPDVGGAPLYAANELHVPVGRPIHLHIRSADVIHSFWVPRLGHKLDAIPGHHNVLALQASAPATLIGQCSEFCGLWHARMNFIVHAQAEQDLSASLEQIAATPARNDGPGADAFQRHCATCHSIDPRQRIRGGPNLANYASRRELSRAQPARTDTTEYLEWLAAHPTSRPSSPVPATLAPIEPEELERIATYLESLK